MRGDHRGDTKHKNTFDVYKPKTPNLEKRPPVTPNFEPFGRYMQSMNFSVQNDVNLLRF
jgi:hypothetical protein